MLPGFEQTDFSARLGEFISSHTTARSGANNDDIVGFGGFFQLEIRHGVVCGRLKIAR